MGYWAAKWQTDPWGGRRDDLGHAVVAHVVASAWMKKGGGGSWRLQDFMPLHPEEPDEQAKARALSQRLRAALSTVGKREKRKP